MKSFIGCFALLSCIALAASYAIDLKPVEEAAPAIVPQNDGECASTCLWAGVYNFPSFQNCRRYIHCVHGFQFDLECSAGEEFDHITLRCQPEARGRCALEGPVDDDDSSSEESSEETSEESSSGTSEEDSSEGTSEESSSGTSEESSAETSEETSEGTSEETSEELTADTKV